MKMDSWERARLKVMYGIWDEEDGKCRESDDDYESKEDDYEKYGY